MQDTLNSTSAHGYCTAVNPSQSKILILALTIHLSGNITHAHLPMHSNESDMSPLSEEFKVVKLKFPWVFASYEIIVSLIIYVYVL